MSVTINVDGLKLRIPAKPLTQEAFAPFGDVVSNPRPDLHPTTYASQGGQLPYNGVSANQGTAIQYRNVSRPRNLYQQAPSGNGNLIISNFVCGARQLESVDGLPSFTVSILERHPFTSQTFSPLASSSSPASYLVIVAPSLPPSAADAHLPVPSGEGLPGRGRPDVARLRAFLATGKQAVTYGAATWHAPMVALGKEGTSVDFLVVQWSSGVGQEDCQLALFEGDVEGVKVVITADRGEKSKRLERL